ncbi:ABC transporter substrate-binding protein [Alloscardovia theropitheci]|nr:ABC transporter substrate-binding protein [Alloscardovia theropitheci]
MKKSPAQKRSVNPGVIFIATLLVLTLIVGGVWAVITHGVRLPLTQPSSAGNGTTLKVATDKPLNSLDITTDTSTALDQALLGNVYQTLVGRNEKNEPTTTGIAQKWDISSDALTYTFTLHRNMRFSNGHTLNAEDVVASLRSTIENQTAGYDRLSHISAVNGNSDTVTLKLSTPDPTLLWSLSTRSGIVLDAESSNDKATSAVGSGPYQVESFDKGKSLTLTANNQYWGSPLEGSSTVVLTSYSDTTAAVDDLNKGSIDAIIPLANSPAVSNISQARDTLEKSSNVTVTATASTHRWAITLNNSADSIFSDTHIRQAYRAMLDKSSLISQLGISAMPISGPVASLDPGYEDYNGLYPYDLQQARQLLSFFAYNRNITLSYPASYGDALAQAIASQLSALGGSVTPQAVPDDQWNAQVVEGKNFDMALVDFVGSHDLGTVANPSYFTSYTNADMENNWEAAQEATSNDTYVDNVHKVASRLAEDAPLLWLYEEQPLVAARGSITGLPTALADAYVDFARIIKK